MRSSRREGGNEKAACAEEKGNGGAPEGWSSVAWSGASITAYSSWKQLDCCGDRERAWEQCVYVCDGVDLGGKLFQQFPVL